MSFNFLAFLAIAALGFAAFTLFFALNLFLFFGGPTFFPFGGDNDVDEDEEDDEDDEDEADEEADPAAEH